MCLATIQDERLAEIPRTRTVTVIGLAVVGVVSAVLVPAVIAAGTSLMNPVYDRKEIIDFSFDPAIGTTFPSEVAALVSKAHRKANLDGSLLVLWGGDCTGCSAVSVDYNALPVKTYDSILIIYETPAHLLKEQYKQNKAPNVYIVSDMARATQRGMNPLWAGRWYVYKERELLMLSKSKEALVPGEIEDGN